MSQPRGSVLRVGALMLVVAGAALLSSAASVEGWSVKVSLIVAAAMLAAVGLAPLWERLLPTRGVDPDGAGARSAEVVVDLLTRHLRRGLWRPPETGESSQGSAGLDGLLVPDPIDLDVSVLGGEEGVRRLIEIHAGDGDETRRQVAGLALVYCDLDPVTGQPLDPRTRLSLIEGRREVSRHASAKLLSGPPPRPLLAAGVLLGGMAACALLALAGASPWVMILLAVGIGIVGARLSH